MIKPIYPYFVLIARFFIGILFLYASIDKIKHPSEFAEIVANYQLLPYGIVNLFSLILPWVELICGIALIIGFRIKSCAFILSCLTFIFIIALGINIIRGVDINCGCFSTEAKNNHSMISLLIRDILIFGLIIFLIKEKYYFFSLDNYFNLKDSKLKSNYS